MAALAWAIAGRGGLVEPSIGAQDAAPAIRFVDVTARSGVTFRFSSDLRRGRSLATTGGGVAAADFDGDGFVDLFFTGSVKDGRRPERGPRGALYRNRRDGSFEERAAAAGIVDLGWSMGAHFVDLDGDGRPDLIVTASGGNRLYHNLGGGRFETVPNAGGLKGGGWSVGAAFLDADRDGRLDVYIGNYLDTDYAREQKFPMFQVRTPDDYRALDNALYLQQADASFADASARSGAVLPGGKTLGAAGFDADGDGTLDIFVANDRSPNALFKGRGDGTFEDATAASGIEEITGRTGPRAGMGIAVGDCDGDGDTDLLVTNFAGEPVTLYLNTGNGIFEDASQEAGLAKATWPYVQWGVQFEDLDNDGIPDIPVVSGHLVPKILTVMAGLFRKGGAGPYGRGDRSYRQPAVLFRGEGGGRFLDVTRSSGDFGRMRISARGSACADFDGDGRLDLAIAAVSGGVRILRNATPNAGHAIEILPVGAGEGRTGPTVVGTRLAVTAGGRRQVREFIVIPSFASGAWLPVHFGLGAATLVDRLEVYSPGAKNPTAVFEKVPADALYTVGPEGLHRVRPFEPRSE